MAGACAQWLKPAERLSLILDRETGKPVHSVREMPVPDRRCRTWRNAVSHTAHSVHRERQADGACVRSSPPKCPRPNSEKFTVVPHHTDGAPGASSHPVPTEVRTTRRLPGRSPQTGLLRVWQPSTSRTTSAAARGYFSAYDPTTGELKWRQIFEGYGQAGPVVTAGGLAFVGTGSNLAGYFFAFDAKTGEQLWKFNTGSGVFSSPATYVVNGEQFVAVASAAASAVVAAEISS